MGELKALSLEEKIGQLFIVPACPFRGEEHREDLRVLIEKYHIGGVLFKQGTVSTQRALIEWVSPLSQIPLLCMQDGEWGVGMRITDALSFPKNLTLGAVQERGLLKEMGKEIGRQCRLVGAHVNLAPVVDVNVTAHNPIIGMRSFGEDPQEVALRALLVKEGMEAMGVMACIKHFPGHGSTEIDSHIDLPLVLCSDEQPLSGLSSALYPFQCIIEAGVGAVMTAHLRALRLDEFPVSFSHRIVTGLLQEKLGFAGLIITDALNMRALSRYYSIEEIAVRAFLAGHDLLLYGDHIAPNIDQILREDVPQAFLGIKRAIERGEITEEMLDRRVDKILKAKRELGVFERNAFQGEIHSEEGVALKRRLFQEAVTVVRNEGVLPLGGTRVILIESGESCWFREALEKECVVTCYSLESLEWMSALEEEVPVIASLARCKEGREDRGKEREALQLLLQRTARVICVLFETPYRLAEVPLFDGLVVAFENEREAQEAAAEVIRGRIASKGRLPVSILPYFPKGTGLYLSELKSCP